MKINSEYESIIISFFLDGRNYGWIRTRELPSDIFFHMDKLQRDILIIPKIGMKAKFILKYSKEREKYYVDEVRIYDN